MVPLLSTFNVGVKQSFKKLMEAADLAYTMKPFRIETERSHAGLYTKLSIYVLIPSFSLSLLHRSEVLLHSSTSACQTTTTTETQLLQPTLLEQTPVIDLSSPTSLSKLSYYFGESCSTSCRPKILCLTCLNRFISFQEFSISLTHSSHIHAYRIVCF